MSKRKPERRDQRCRENDRTKRTDHQTTTQHPERSESVRSDGGEVVVEEHERETPEMEWELVKERESNWEAIDDVPSIKEAIFGVDEVFEDKTRICDKVSRVNYV